LEYGIESGRQSHLVCIEGNLDINGSNLGKRDAKEITGKEHLILKAVSRAYLIVIEMGQE
jgi:hypothetical protein